MKRSCRAACRIAFGVSTGKPARMDASCRFGVMRKASGINVLDSTRRASSAISGAPCLLIMTGSTTSGKGKRTAAAAIASTARQREMSDQLHDTEARSTLTYVRQGRTWLITAFHNTLVASVVTGRLP